LSELVQLGERVKPAARRMATTLPNLKADEGSIGVLNLKAQGEFCKMASADSEVSTAASSVEQSPLGGPGKVTAMADWGLEDLGSKLVTLIASTESTPTSTEDRKFRVQRYIEWCFSAQSLRHNRHLRSHMDGFGWVNLGVVVGLPSLRQMSVTPKEAAAALQPSTEIQVSGDLRRIRATDPLQWIGSKQWSWETSEGPVFVSAVDVADEELTIAASIEGVFTQHVARQKHEKGFLEQPTSETRAMELRLDTLLFSEKPSVAMKKQKGCHQKGTHAKEQGGGFWVPAHIPPAVFQAYSPAAAWVRTTGDAYLSASAALLQW